MMGRLSGKTVIVSGAASGIGRAAATLFGSEGANVVAFDIASTVEDVVAEIAGSGSQAIALTGDSGHAADVDRVIDRCLATYGRLDVFFANSGISGPRVTFDDLTTDDWGEVLRINLIGPFLAIQKGAHAMQKSGGGSIICTASIAGLRASTRAPLPYSASKAAVISLVQTSAKELGPRGIRVNAICPGFIETGMTQDVFRKANVDGARVSLSDTPIDRPGQPIEIANTALFLASDEASYLTGQAIVVDGGMSTVMAGGLAPAPGTPQS